MDLLRSFIIFQKVAEIGSFSGAAQSLGIVPSAVSRQVSELEDWSGLRLINRTTRSLHLTPEGELYLEKLARITTDVEDLKELGQTTHSLSGRITLTTPMMLGQFVIPGALARFQSAHPNVELSVTLMNRTVDIIEEGFDVAIRAGQLPDSSLMSRKIGNVRMTTVASKAYLNKRGIPSKPRDLALHDCLIGDPVAKAARWSFLNDGKDIGVKVAGTISANDSLCLKALSLAGVGIARLPINYVSSELQSGALIEILPNFAPLPTPINIVHHYGRKIRPTLRAFVDFMADDLRRNSLDSFAT